MCNLYAMMKGRAEAAQLAGAFSDRNNNQPPMSGVYPDYAAPIITRTPDGGREMRDVRWGLPSSSQALFVAAKKRADKLRAKGQDFDFSALLKMEPDRGTTNVRNTDSKHWTRWLGPENRCLVPFTSFSEPDQVGGSLQPVWFALDEHRPLAFFAGVWTPWTCVRKVTEGEVSCDLFGFLTTDANADVATYHSKAMPVILTEPADCDLWLSDAPWPEVRPLQRPLPDGALKVVVRGVRKDESVPA
ncbi:MAG TPA: SOS response-associated peptidase [Phenylobacterium sp.]|jgi:putative SOS response-associated peptidase YedK